MGIALEAPRWRGESGAELHLAPPGEVAALGRFERRASVDGAGQRAEVGAHVTTRVALREGKRTCFEEALGACVWSPLGLPGGGALVPRSVFITR